VDAVEEDVRKVRAVRPDEPLASMVAQRARRSKVG